MVVAATAFIDRLDDLGCVESRGVIRSLTRKATILFQSPPANDHSIVKLALNVLDAESPSLKTFSIPTGAGFESLRLINREPKVRNDPIAVEVILKYEHVLDGANQILPINVNDPGIPSKMVYVKGKASVVEKTTNFYVPPGLDKEDSNNRRQIAVAHTYPPTDLGIAGMPLLPDLPFTVLQGGEVNIPFPQENFKLEGVCTTINPRAIKDAFIAKINSKPWLGKKPHFWMCSEVDFEVLNATANPVTNTYKFTFEFQYNVDSWDPTVVFNDQRTGRPPADVRKATLLDTDGVMNKVTNPYLFGLFPPLFRIQYAGMWNVPALNEADFPKLLASFFE